jgi:hypothetical protein
MLSKQAHLISDFISISSLIFSNLFITYNKGIVHHYLFVVVLIYNDFTTDP